MINEKDERAARFGPTTTITTTTCLECPFSERDDFFGDVVACSVSDSGDTAYKRGGPQPEPPPSCPLRVGPVTVRRK